MDQEILCFLL